MTDHRTREEIEHDRMLEERAAPYVGRTLTEAERLDPESWRSSIVLPARWNGGAVCHWASMNRLSWRG